MDAAVFLAFLFLYYTTRCGAVRCDGSAWDWAGLEGGWRRAGWLVCRGHGRGRGKRPYVRTYSVGWPAAAGGRMPTCPGPGWEGPGRVGCSFGDPPWSPTPSGRGKPVLLLGRWSRSGPLGGHSEARMPCLSDV
jgi:hypothetical protein